tara:strand:- start:274 stop:1890 length:1617 start_codon:yes stop_codon:yes gene_type:complete
MKVFSSSGFIAAGSSVNGTAQRYDFVVGTSLGSYDGNTTTFPAIYDAGFADVYLNGIKLVKTTDFTATSGSSVVLAVAASSADEVNIVAYGTFSLANFSIGAANDVDLSGGVTAGKVLSYNNSTSKFEPSTKLATTATGIDVTGTVVADGLTVDGNASYTGTLTGGTGVVNIGSGQVYKDAAGNLGLGVTPSAWASFSGILQNSDTIAISGLGFTRNMYYNAGYKYIGTGNAVRYGNDSGVHAWYNAPSGTAGAAISFTQAMTLDASGNLGIGTSSPAAVGAYRVLDLNNATGGYLSLSAGGSRVGAVYANSSATGLEAIGEKYIQFLTNSAERARIDSAGNVGIGTSSPTGPLDVVANSGAAALVLRGRASDSISAQRFVNNAGTTEYARFQVDSSSNLIVATGSGSTERMRIDSSGNLKFDSGYGSAATAYGCRAWVNFNGTGTVAIRNSGGVSTVADNTTGDYTINFSSSFPDSNYAFLGNGNASGTGVNARGPVITQHTTMTASAFRFYTNRNGDNGAGPVNLDHSIVTLSFVR